MPVKIPLRRWSILMWVFVGIIVLIILALPVPLHQVEFDKIAGHRDKPLNVVVYRPLELPKSKVPAVIICQPLNNPPEYSRALALELVQHGFIVLTFDWRGNTPTENRQIGGSMEGGAYDVGAAVKYLRGLPEVDADNICIAGHSVGATFALDYGLRDREITAIASIGMAADITAESPNNVLWAVGLYDEFRSLTEMRDTLETSIGSSGELGSTHGDITAGTARRLSVSPTADHFTELQDRHIHRMVADWFLRATELSSDRKSMLQGLRQSLYFLAGWFILISGLMSIRTVFVDSKIPVRSIPIVGLVAILVVSFLDRVHPIIITDTILLTTLFALGGGYFASTPKDQLGKVAWPMLKVCFVLWLSIIGALLVNNVPHLLEFPTWILSIPELALRLPVEWMNAYLVMYMRQLAFSHYGPDFVSPRIFLYVLVIVEIISPGLLLRSFQKFISLRSRRPSESKEKHVRKWSPGQVVVFAALILALCSIGVWRFQQGFLTGESSRAALKFIVRFGLVPLAIYIFTWRIITKWSQSQKSEKLKKAP